MMKNKIDVSVYIITYYHEKYISQAIESVLTQKTKYNFEIVISDDCSHDETPKIIKQYQSKYPEKIHININSENEGIASNIYKARCMCNGRYIVACSGDDYFIDDYKLEKQVSFLDEHSDCFGVVGRMQIRNNFEKSGRTIPDIKFTGYNYTLKHYERNIVFPTRGLLIRNLFLSKEGREYFGIAKSICDKCDEIVENYLILNKGPVYIMPDIMDCYRWITDNNANNYNSIFSTYEKYIHALTLYRGLYDRYGDTTNFSKHFLNHYPGCVLWCLKRFNLKKLHIANSIIPKEYKNLIFYIDTLLISIRIVILTIFRRL